MSKERRTRQIKARLCRVIIPIVMIVTLYNPIYKYWLSTNLDGAYMCFWWICLIFLSLGVGGTIGDIIEYPRRKKHRHHR